MFMKDFLILFLLHLLFLIPVPLPGPPVLRWVARCPLIPTSGGREIIQAQLSGEERSPLKQVLKEVFDKSEYLFFILVCFPVRCSIKCFYPWKFKRNIFEGYTFKLHRIGHPWLRVWFLKCSTVKTIREDICTFLLVCLDALYDLVLYQFCHSRNLDCKSLIPVKIAIYMELLDWM